MKIIFAIFWFVFIINCNGKINDPVKTERTYNFSKNNRKYKILIFDSQNAEPYKSARESALNVLKLNGLVQGKNLEIIYHSIGNNERKGINLLRKEVKNKPDAIFINGTIMAIAAKKAFFNSSNYNFVFACVTDPVGIGLVKSMSKPPDFNFTGVSYPVPVKSRFKFIKELIPGVKKIGLIYADMPQSRSYRRWVENLIKNNKDFKDIKVYFRKVPLFKGERGSRKMALAARKYIKELNPVVDVFISPNDQMGVKKDFPLMVEKYGKKPLIGVSEHCVMKKRGATAVIYPSHRSMGSQSAYMIMKLLKGDSIKSIKPEWPKVYGLAFNIKKVKKFKVRVPIEFIKLAGNNIISE